MKRITAICGLALMLPLLAHGADPAAPAATPITLDPQAVEAWMDSQVDPALKSSGMPGAVAAVVQRGGVVLVKGYGVSDVAQQIPVKGDVTLFETASIGKSMTALLTAQLAQEGVLNLDEDVNRYLKSAQVTGPTVTLRMLLGHRGGFDDDISELFARFDGDIHMSTAELNRRLRPLVPPGYVSAYDNQGYGVIGLVLRDVTGKSIPDLYHERLFEPAGMTGAAHGRPADGKARLAHCYTVQGPGAVQECEYWLYRDGLMGAGGVAASGADMARYMRLLLNGGTLDGREVISPAAFADVTNFDHFRFHPGMPGGGHAFVQFEEFRGLEYAHSGSMPGFSSMMKIYPDADVGIFFSFLGGQFGSFNLSATGLIQALKDVDMKPDAKPGLEVLRNITDTFADKFIPAGKARSSTSPEPWPALPPEHLEDFLGSYVLTTAHSTCYAARVINWMSQLRLERVGESAVRLGGPYAALGEFHRVAPYLYESAKGQRLAFAELPIGRFVAVGLSGGVFRQTNALDSPTWGLMAFVLATVILLTTLFQLRWRANPSVRRLAGWSLVGLLLVWGGLFAEWQWGIKLAIVEGSFTLPVLWRLGLHVGAALLLWHALCFFRYRVQPVGRASLVHGFLIAAAALLVVIVLLAWRVLGSFPPYINW